MSFNYVDYFIFASFYINRLNICKKGTKNKEKVEKIIQFALKYRKNVTIHNINAGVCRATTTCLYTRITDTDVRWGVEKTATYVL